jgi:hypothetical protein
MPRIDTPPERTMPTAATARSIGLVLAISVTAGILGTIGHIAAAERQAAVAAAQRAPTAAAAQLAVACDPAPDARL